MRQTAQTNQQTPISCPSVFLNTAEAARILNLKTGTLEVWRVYGRGPVFYRFGRAIRYRREDLEQWAAQRACQNTSE